MKKILPAILGITLAGTLATCTQKDTETVVQTPSTKAPEVAEAVPVAPTPTTPAPVTENTTPVSETTSGATVATVAPSVVATSTGTNTDAGSAENSIPKMNAEGKLEPTQAVKDAQEKGDVAVSPTDEEMKAKLLAQKPAPTPIATIQPIEKTVKYKTPGGLHSVTFNITLLDGKINGVRVTPSADNEVSTKFQVKFGEEISSKVVGKDVKGLKIDALAGASLTTKAFNEFLGEI